MIQVSEAEAPVGKGRCPHGLENLRAWPGGRGSQPCMEVKVGMEPVSMEPEQATRCNNNWDSWPSYAPVCRHPASTCIWRKCCISPSGFLVAMATPG